MSYKFEYNTEKPPITLKEYGRNVQKLVEKICNEKDKQERNNKIDLLIRVMKSVNPKVYGIPNDSRKLWDDLFIVSNYKLDIDDAPYPMPEKNILKKKVSRLPYRKDDITFKHYGRNIKLLINKAGEEKDEKLKESLFLEVIRIMRGYNTNWNNDRRDIGGVFEDIKEMYGKDKDLGIDLDEIKEKIINTTQRNRNNMHSVRPSYTQNNYGWGNS